MCTRPCVQLSVGPVSSGIGSNAICFAIYVPTPDTRSSIGSFVLSFMFPYDCRTLMLRFPLHSAYSPEDTFGCARATPSYMKNSSVEWDSGSHVRPGRSSMDISITRSPRYTGSVICSPFGLYTRSFCIAMYFDTFRRHFS